MNSLEKVIVEFKKKSAIQIVIYGYGHSLSTFQGERGMVSAPACQTRIIRLFFPHHLHRVLTTFFFFKYLHFWMPSPFIQIRTRCFWKLFKSIKDNSFFSLFHPTEVTSIISCFHKRCPWPYKIDFHAALLSFHRAEANIGWIGAEDQCAIRSPVKP